MYESGYGVDKDYAEARKWYLKAAEANDAWSQKKMGDMCYDGKGKDKDYVKAVKWYRKAAEQGYAAAEYSIGYMYREGYGVNQDYSELLSHFIIDTSKARLSVRFPYLSDIRGKPYWMLFGCDQLLHQFVIVIIWFVSHQ